MFKSDFRIVADYFVQIRKTGQYKGTTDTIKHIYDTLKLLSVMKNDDRYIQAYYYTKVKGEIRNMCDVLDRIEKIGADKKEKEMRAVLAQKDKEIARKDKEIKATLAQKDKEIARINKNNARQETDMRESFAKKMLASGISQAQVVECSGLSKTRVAKLAKIIAAVI
ncbi:MAG: hypothetical protein IJ242_08570 [Clostridia bacterium]|nr:hypothetical protein [Clostridia bacterium]